MNDLANWSAFLAALIAFLASHAIPARPPIRHYLVAKVGRWPYLLSYSVLSIFLLVWLIQSAGAAPYVEVWPFADWQRWVPITAMPLAFAIGIAGLFSPNPLSLSASKRAFDPNRPGMVALTRHPVLAALGIWFRTETLRT